MKNPLKILLILLALIFGYLIFKISTPPFSVKIEKATNLSPKIYPTGERKDSTMVYVPYKITIRKYRLLPIHFHRIDDENYKVGDIENGNLVFNTDKLDLNKPMDDRYANFTDRQKARNRNVVFPFLTRDFYYYKGTPVKVNFKNIGIEKLISQIHSFDENINQAVSKKTTDSIYKSDDGKRFNVVFREKYFYAHIKAKINRAEQIPVKYSDSVKGMGKEQLRIYLYKLAHTKIQDELKDF